MKRTPTSKPFPSTPEEIAAAIAAAPERVVNADSSYDPNEATAVEEYWQHAQVRRPGQRGPGKKPAKILLSVRYSPEVVEFFKATGEGWQARLDDALKARDAGSAVLAGSNRPPLPWHECPGYRKGAG